MAIGVTIFALVSGSLCVTHYFTVSVVSAFSQYRHRSCILPPTPARVLRKFPPCDIRSCPALRPFPDSPKLFPPLLLSASFLFLVVPQLIMTIHDPEAARRSALGRKLNMTHWGTLLNLDHP